LPEGYDTVIGERGVKLSGGQKQRLSIARAVLRNTPILIFDEATAAVDVETEAKIQQAIQELTESRTIIVVAHRLSTVKRADTILVIENGKIAESGNHSELLAYNGVYKQLCEIQFSSEEF
jgi:ABC-type multidrug transport system fused ATPase/permease subunit